MTAVEKLKLGEPVIAYRTESDVLYGEHSLQMIKPEPMVLIVPKGTKVYTLANNLFKKQKQYGEVFAVEWKEKEGSSFSLYVAHRDIEDGCAERPFDKINIADIVDKEPANKIKIVLHDMKSPIRDDMFVVYPDIEFAPNWCKKK